MITKEDVQLAADRPIHSWEHKTGIVYRCSMCGIYGKDRRGTPWSSPAFETANPGPRFMEDAVRRCVHRDLSKTRTLRVSMELEGAHLDQTIEIPSAQQMEEIGKDLCAYSGLDAEIEILESISQQLKDELTRGMLTVLLMMQKQKT